MNLLHAIRSGSAYEAWRRFRGWQKLRRFRIMLDEQVLPAGRLISFTVDDLKAELSHRARYRRPVSVHCKIIGFGTNDWEAYGLWQAFEKRGPFELFDYKAEMSKLGHSRPSKLARDLLERSFLNFLDDPAQQASIVFLYADAKYISPSLLDAIASRGVWTVLMGLDDKQVFRKYHRAGMVVGQETLVSHADVYWTTWRSGIGAIRRAGGRPWYQPEAASPIFYRPVEVPREFDVVFVGAAYGFRRELVKYLRGRGFSVCAVGPGWPGGVVSHEGMIDLFARGHVVLGVGDVGNCSSLKHLKARDFEVPMCRGLYLTSYNSELCDHFDVGHEITCYSSKEECVEVLLWLLANPDEAEAIRKRGFERAIEDHSWDNRLCQLIDLFTQSGH